MVFTVRNNGKLRFMLYGGTLKANNLVEFLRRTENIQKRKYFDIR